MLVNPSGLYGGGDFRVDTTPALNFFLKQQAREQAKQKSLNKYFSTLTDRVNDKDVRTVDMDAFNTAVQNYKDFYSKNSKELSSGKRPDLVSKAEQLAKIPFRISQQSRMVTTDSKKLRDIWAGNPELRSRLSDETSGIDPRTGKPMLDPNGNPMGLVANEEPLYVIGGDGSLIENPKWKPINIENVVYNPKLLPSKELNERVAIAFSKPSTNESVLGVDPYDKSKDIVEIRSEYTPEQVIDAANSLRDIYKDREVSYTFKKSHPNDFKDFSPEEFKAAQEAFNLAYPGQEMDDMEDLFVGANLAKNITPQVKRESRENKTRAAQIAANISLQKSKELSTFNKSLSGEGGSETPNEVWTPFDSMQGDIPGTGLKIQDGRVYDKNGQPYTGTVPVIPKSMIHSDVIKKFTNKPILLESVSAKVNNGVIESMANQDFGTVDRMAFMADKKFKLPKGVRAEQSVQKAKTEKSNKKSIPGF